MASLIRLKDDFISLSGNDPDFDRHGIVTRSAGLMNPNHYLRPSPSGIYSRIAPDWRAARPWARDAGLQLDDRPRGRLAGAAAGRSAGRLQIFVDGLLSGDYFGGEESAGASFLRHDGTVWTTDKDGFIMDLLAVRIMARTGRDPSEHYRGADGTVRRPATSGPTRQ